MIEDFDSEIAPELARALSRSMPGCRFRHLTRPSHDILELLRAGKIEIGIAAQPQYDASDLVEFPLLRDPFVLAVPADHDVTAEACLEGSTSLPLLRYSTDQIIGRQIEAQLRRLRLSPPNRFEFESNQDDYEHGRRCRGLGDHDADLLCPGDPVSAAGAASAVPGQGVCPPHVGFHPASCNLQRRWVQSPALCASCSRPGRSTRRSRGCPGCRAALPCWPIPTSEPRRPVRGSGNFARIAASCCGVR